MIKYNMAEKGKINEILLEEIAGAVRREVAIDNALITISYVDCSPDLKQAKVGFSVLPDVLAGTAGRLLSASTGRIIDSLKKRVKIRQIPKISWEFDATEKEAARLEKLISSLE